MWYLVTLSMPNSGPEPHGKVTASATPFSRMSRTSGALDCTLVPPSCVTHVAMVACAGRIFMPLISPGTLIFLVLEWNEPGSWKNAKQNFTSFISLSGYFRYPSSSAPVPSLAFDTMNGRLPASMIGKRPGWEAGATKGTSGGALGAPSQGGEA